MLKDIENQDNQQGTAFYQLHIHPYGSMICKSLKTLSGVLFLPGLKKRTCTIPDCQLKDRG